MERAASTPPPDFGGNLAVAADAGGPPRVRVFDAVSHELRFEFLAYDQGYVGGVRVAVGDTNRDGVADIITSQAVGQTVRVFDGRNGDMLSSFTAYTPDEASGAFVATADVNGDGQSDIITGNDAGATALVKMFNGRNVQFISSFQPESMTGTGGVRVAAGDVDGNGRAGDHCGGGSRQCAANLRLRRLQGCEEETLNFLASDPTSTGGVYVTAGDLNGDGKSEIIAGLDSGNRPEVRVFDSSTKDLARFNAYDTSFRKRRPRWRGRCQRRRPT